MVSEMKRDSMRKTASLAGRGRCTHRGWTTIEVRWALKRAGESVEKGLAPLAETGRQGVGGRAGGRLRPCRVPKGIGRAAADSQLRMKREEGEAKV